MHKFKKELHFPHVISNCKQPRRNKVFCVLLSIALTDGTSSSEGSLSDCFVMRFFLALFCATTKGIKRTIAKIKDSSGALANVAHPHLLFCSSNLSNRHRWRKKSSTWCRNPRRKWRSRATKRDGRTICSRRCWAPDTAASTAHH